MQSPSSGEPRFRDWERVARGALMATFGFGWWYLGHRLVRWLDHSTLLTAFDAWLAVSVVAAVWLVPWAAEAETRAADSTPAEADGDGGEAR
ncbi:MAG: hypothetical protein HYV93_05065 [Candidatus Rokubacteria bacterium]|nr:hypothetical protein [Candidatus Rokubacteria bacterium]